MIWTHNVVWVPGDWTPQSYGKVHWMASSTVTTIFAASWLPLAACLCSSQGIFVLDHDGHMESSKVRTFAEGEIEYVHPYFHPSVSTGAFHFSISRWSSLQDKRGSDTRHSKHSFNRYGQRFSVWKHPQISFSNIPPLFPRQTHHVSQSHVVSCSRYSYRIWSFLSSRRIITQEKSFLHPQPTTLPIWLSQSSDFLSVLGWKVYRVYGS